MKTAMNKEIKAMFGSMDKILQAEPYKRRFTKIIP